MPTRSNSNIEQPTTIYVPDRVYVPSLIHDDKPLGPYIEGFLKAYNDMEKPTSVEATRIALDQMFLDYGFPDVEAGKVEEHDFSIEAEDKHKIPCKVIVPTESVYKNDKGALPVYIYLHGGGWVLGSIKSHNTFCRNIAVETGSIVVQVDYRLAPEHPYPKPYTDCRDALDFFINHKNEKKIPGVVFDSKRVGLGGDSAGGAITMALVLYKSQVCDSHPVAYSTAMCPVLDCCDFLGTNKHAESSINKFAVDYFLTSQDMNMFNMCYSQCNPEIMDDYRCNPAKFFMRPTPIYCIPCDTYILDATHDVLRDRVRDIAPRLAHTGCNVTTSSYHGFHTGYLFAKACGEESCFAVLHEISAYIRKSLDKKR